MHFTDFEALRVAPQVRLDQEVQGAATIKATYKKFSAKLNVQKTDWEFEYKDGDLLKIRQALPGGKTYLLPSPVITVVKPIKGGLSLGLEGNFEKRVHLVQGLYKFGDSSEYKLDVGTKTDHSRWLKFEYSPKGGKTLSSAKVRARGMTRGG